MENCPVFQFLFLLCFDSLDKYIVIPYCRYCAPLYCAPCFYNVLLFLSCQYRSIHVYICVF